VLFVLSCVGITKNHLVFMEAVQSVAVVTVTCRLKSLHCGAQSSNEYFATVTSYSFNISVQNLIFVIITAARSQ